MASAARGANAARDVLLTRWLPVLFELAFVTWPEFGATGDDEEELETGRRQEELL